jgi:hypothetical protein
MWSAPSVTGMALNFLIRFTGLHPILERFRIHNGICAGAPLQGFSPGVFKEAPTGVPVFDILYIWSELP